MRSFLRNLAMSVMLLHLFAVKPYFLRVLWYNKHTLFSGERVMAKNAQSVVKMQGTNNPHTTIDFPFSASVFYCPA